MKMQPKKLKWVMILAVLSVASCGAAKWTAPPSWTLREDGRLRASQRKENFSSREFIAKIKKEENREYAYVVTPAGEAKIARELRFRAAEITRLKNELANCR